MFDLFRDLNYSSGEDRGRTPPGSEDAAGDPAPPRLSHALFRRLERIHALLNRFVIPVKRDPL